MRALRNIRAEYGIEPAVKTGPTIVCEDAALAALITAELKALALLSKVDRGLCFERGLCLEWVCVEGVCVRRGLGAIPTHSNTHDVRIGPTRSPPSVNLFLPPPQACIL